MDIIIKGIQMIYQFLWGDLITIPLPGESSLGLGAYPDSIRHLLYHPHPLSALPLLSRNAENLHGKEDFFS